MYTIFTKLTVPLCQFRPCRADYAVSVILL